MSTIKVTMRSSRTNFDREHMKVTKAQAQANRAHIVETASTVFRQHGYDGISVADLMAAAGFTHGGFYKQFRSKADLMAESASCGLAKTVETSANQDIEQLVRIYLSREHRDNLAGGCTIAALSGDAARQPAEVRASFQAGIEDVLAALQTRKHSEGRPIVGDARKKHINMLAHAVGALVMSRSCPDDSALADEILEVCLENILANLADQTQG
jgi:TetR/AcrR family transcriptional repressor of nem operon